MEIIHVLIVVMIYMTVYVCQTIRLKEGYITLYNVLAL